MLLQQYSYQYRYLSCQNLHHVNFHDFHSRLHEYSLRIKTIMEKITILDTHNNKNNNYRYGNNDLSSPI